MSLPQNSRYVASNEFGGEPGKPCANCGEPGHRHDKVKVHTENGRYHYEYRCPGGA